MCAGVCLSVCCGAEVTQEQSVLQSVHQPQREALYITKRCLADMTGTDKPGQTNTSGEGLWTRVPDSVCFVCLFFSSSVLFPGLCVTEGLNICSHQVYRGTASFGICGS